VDIHRLWNELLSACRSQEADANVEEQEAKVHNISMEIGERYSSSMSHQLANRHMCFEDFEISGQAVSLRAFKTSSWMGAESALW
jgi:hypothetical protein